MDCQNYENLLKENTVFIQEKEENLNIQNLELNNKHKQIPLCLNN